MRVAVQQEDLQLLARTLQEQFLAEVPFGEVFQIKCAVNQDELMILTQHPVAVTVDTQQIFAVLEEVLQSVPTYKEQRVQCFLRVFGDKLPYAKHSLTMKQRAIGRAGEAGEEVSFLFPSPSSFSSSSSSFSSSSSSLTYSPLIEDSQEEEEELFDPLADTPDLLTTPRKRPIKPILLGAALVGIIVLGGGAYLLTRPCVMSECKEIQAAQKLKTESRQLTSRAKSESELVAVQKRLETTSADLAAIPSWSSRYQQAEELKASLSGQSAKINQVVKALQTAAVAAQKTQTPAQSLEELQTRQHLWRQAIAPLETINPNSELYKLVQPKLLKYRLSLQTVNQQLQAQERWLKKLTAAKGVASVAIKREANAKSLNDWRKVQSTWQIAVNALIVIPSNSPAAQEAQKLLLEYKPKLATARDRATKEQLAAQSYQQAVNAAKQARAYEKLNQWQAAVVYWGQAFQTAKQISQDSFYYSSAQSLIEPYSAALKQAQEKLELTNSLQQTRNDLNKTCSDEIRICTFNVNDKGITVSLTPEYEQILQSSSSEADPQNAAPVVDATNHLQVLEEALSVISDNANIPLLLYDTQGQGIYTRIPGG
ncbi:hypothetical protein [Halotia branconii]|uniref:Uncharacterized protein n=1 Tax=Halotia branconii CENA392 TaxID=1539056 RepID=A0AAJ6NQE7_9CYAN|nr:hypothetical protein [Halotia branconii]WGV24695.1 hypothetical protein QI031_23455 [Halotia branconii CENA392]